LRGPVKRIIDSVEKATIADLKDEAAKANDKALVSQLSAKIDRDAPWNHASKGTLEECLPNVVAKGLNRLGISSEYSDEVLSAVAAFEIGASYSSLKEELKKMIVEFNAQQQPDKKAA